MSRSRDNGNPILVLVGMPGSGKSSVARHLKRKGWSIIHFGERTMIELQNRGLPISEANERMVREELRDEHGTPRWWDAYNAVKHHEYDEFRQGNLENCVNAVAALALLGYEMSAFTSDPLLVNVGLRYGEGVVDLAEERRLFPHE